MEIREATADDAAAVERLTSASADGGAVAFRMTEHIAGFEEPGRSRIRIVAELPGAGIVGSAVLTLGTFGYAGESRPFGLLSSLVVAAEHRRKGVAAALGRWRIERATDAGGPDVVVLADVQRGNAASLAAARKWANGFTGPQITFPATMRAEPFRSSGGVTVRDASSEDLPEIAAGVTAFAAGRDFSRPWTVAALGAWLAASPFPDPVHLYRVAIDPTGRIVAGIALREDGRLRSMTVTRMPGAIRMVNGFLHVIPPDGVLRNVLVEHFWRAPGQDAAARALWEDTRWACRDRGTHVVFTADARDPVRRVLGTRPWSPTTTIVTAVRADPPVSPTGPIVESLV